MKRRSPLILLFLLVAGGGFFVWKASRDGQAESFVMVDGTRITFQAVTVGTNHSHCFGNLFQRAAARIPGRLGEKLHGGTVYKFPTSSQTDIILWFRQREDSASTNANLLPPPSGPVSKVYWRVKLEDEHGNRLNSFTGRSMGKFHSGDFAVFVCSTNIPMTSRSVRVRLESWHGPSDWRVTGEFLVPNPAYRKQP